MKYYSVFFLLFTSQVMAAPKVELPASNISEIRSCAAKAGQLMVRYTSLFDLGRDVKTIRFENFSNTTPGSFNQEYQADITLVHSQEVEFGVNKTRVTATFSSPFICDDLKIVKVEDRGIDNEDPLYKCLHDEEKVGPLEKEWNDAFQIHLDDMAAACKDIQVPEKSACHTAYNQSPVGKAQMDALKAAQEKQSEYNQACFANFKKD